MEPIVLIFPMPQQRGNRKGHSYFESFHKKKWINLVDKFIVLERIKHIKLLPLKAALAEVEIEVFHEFDDDNSTALLKWPFDMLTHYGFIENDDRKNLRLVAPPKQFIERKKERMMKIKLHPMETKFERDKKDGVE